MNYDKRAIAAHKKHQGKIEIRSLMPLKNKADLSIAYTPGVAAVCQLIAADKKAARTHTLKGRTIAVISDGSAILGLGNLGPEAALPVMEGKCALFKQFAGVDAFPIVLATQDTEEIIAAVKAIAPTFGGINLEDIAAPRCFEIEERLRNELDIPVFHDDQHGTAIVVLAALVNALKVTKKHISRVKIVINGAGAAATAVYRICVSAGVERGNVIMLIPRGSSILSAAVCAVIKLILLLKPTEKVDAEISQRRFLTLTYSSAPRLLMCSPKSMLRSWLIGQSYLRSQIRILR